LSEVKQWIDTEVPKIFGILKDEIREHVIKVLKSNPDTYGYAILLGEDLHQSDAISLTSTKSFLDDNKGCDYLSDMKYMPNEWPNWHHEAYENFNSAFEKMYKTFESIFTSSPGSEYDEEELHLLRTLYENYLMVTKELNDEGVFKSFSYVIIWLMDSNRDVQSKSFWQLNEGVAIEEAGKYFEEKYYTSV